MKAIRGRWQLASVTSSKIAAAIAVLAVVAPGLLAQSQAPQQRTLRTAARARTAAVRPPAAVDGPTMTGNDLLHALDLGDPPETIIARIRRNHTSFKNLIELSAGLHAHESAANAAALAQIWQEVSSSVWRKGAPLDPQQAATQPLEPSAAPSSPAPDPPAAPARLQVPAAANVAVPNVQQAAHGPAEAPPAATAVPAPVPAPTSLADNFEITPSVVRVSEQAVEVSEQANTSVTLKNNNDGEVRLGVAQVCLHEHEANGCLPQGEVFQIADGVDKCKNPLANKDQCTVKILFTPHRSFNYNQWLMVPLVDGGGQPLKKSDGTTPEPPLMIPLQGRGFVADMARVEATKANANNPSLRSVVGLDIAGATSTDTQQKLFVDFALNAPIGWSGYTVCSNQRGEPMTDRHGKVLKTAPAVLLGKISASAVIGGDTAYSLCQDLRSPEEMANNVRYIWKDRRTDPLQSRAWWFFNPRITSIPQPGSALSSLNVQGFTDIFSAKQTNIVQGVDVHGGIEVMIVKPRVGRAFYGPFKNTKARLGLAWVLGGGFASPFAAPGTNPTVFTLDPKSPLRHQFQASGTQFCGAPPATSPCDIPASFTNITFVNPERSRFFRKYYSGLRMKTYHFSKSYQSSDCDPGYKNECEGVYNAYPGILDLTVGQDEQVTGGHLSRWLLRLDVAYPLPFLPGTYIFGGVNSAFKKNQNTDPVFLPGTSTTAISDPSVFQVKVPLRDRDNYRLGIGVDLLQVITQAKQGSNKNPAGAGTTPPPPTPPPR